MTGIIQGKDCVFYILVNDVYTPYMCASDISINMTAQKKSVKTVGDGAWDKFAYQSLGYTISLQGVLKFDTSAFTGWDMIANQMNFLTVSYKATFTSGSNVRSIAGQAIIETSQLTINPSNVVIESYTLPGTGAPLVFDGASPCNIVITAAAASSGISSHSVTGNYTGSDLAAIKIVANGGPAQYPVFTHTSSTFSFTFNYIGLSGTYPLIITPKCANDYAGTPLTINFTKS